MIALTDGQLGALVNLSRKADGQPVDWINIADARALTEAGLAQRSRQGWSITDAGRSFLHDTLPPLAGGGGRG